MKAWLKGGLIGGVIGFILTIFNGIVIYLAFAQEAEKLSMSPSLWTFLVSISRVTLFSVYIPNYLSRFFTLFAYLSLIFWVVVLFILGALIGWIIGKIKSRSS